MRDSVPLFSGSSDIHGSNVEFSGTTTTTRIRKNQFSVRESDSECSPLPFPGGQILKWPELKVFDLEELKSATEYFSCSRLVGDGPCATVYKGWLDENTLTPTKSGSGLIVAIKKLNPKGRLSHPNLVRLLGYCWDEDQFLLVCEFMPNGSFDRHLFERTQPLPWNTMLKILIGAARGLAFLHANQNKVIFKYFKASNVLLDGNYNAKISDFSSAKLLPHGEESYVTTRIMGTPGYAAPECMATGHVYMKSGVYGFGVVLLEVLTGMRAFDPNQPRRQRSLVKGTKPFLSSEKKLKRIMDGRLEGQYLPKAALHAAQLTLKCLKHDPRQRPSMKEVLEQLEAIEDIH